MDQRKWRRGTGFTAMGVIVLLLIGLLWSSSDDSTPASADDSNVPTLEEEIASDLTVRPGDILPEEARCTSDAFNDNSLKQVREGDPAFRQWSDAVSTPFVSSDKDEMLQELFAEHCGNPTELDMSIQALSEVTVSGFNIGENNPWMGEFLAMAEEDGLRTAFMTLKDGEGDNKFVTKDYQSYAAMANTILLAFQNVGVEKEASVYNWHLAGPVAGELPRTVLNEKQEGLPSLKLVYTVKDGCPLVAIGYNVSDKRFEGFKPPVCADVPVTTPPGESTTTTPPGESTTTTRPGTTTSTTRPTTTTTVCTSKYCTGATVTTQAPPPTTAPPRTTTTQPSNGGQGDSGDGSTNTTAPPTTQSPPVTSPPTTTPPGPPPPPPPG